MLGCQEKSLTTLFNPCILTSVKKITLQVVISDDERNQS